MISRLAVRVMLAFWVALSLLALPLLSAAPAAAAANDTSWDDRFGTPGVFDTVNDIAVATDGTAYANVLERSILRWDGKHWQSLGETNGLIKAIATMGTTLYAAGDFDAIGNYPVKDLAKWDGSQWTQVGDGTGPASSDGWGQSSFESLAAVGNTLYVGGSFDLVDGVAAKSIAAWNGSSWSALGSGLLKLDFSSQPTLPGEVYALTSSGGKLYVGGIFSKAGGVSAGGIAVWNGASWSALGSGMQRTLDGDTQGGAIYAIAVNGGTVYAGGQFGKADGKTIANIAMWNGAGWQALGTGLTTTNIYDIPVTGLALDGSGVVAGGRFLSGSGKALNGFARWNGTAWSALGGLTGNSWVETLAQAPDGSYYVGGGFSKLDGVLVSYIARRAGTSWQALGQGVTSIDNNCCAGTVFATVSDGMGHVYAGGSFQTAGGVTVNNIAMWNGTAWQPLGAGVGGGYVRALLLRGNLLYVGGTFQTAGGAAIPYLAVWNITNRTWSGLGSGVNRDVYTLEEADGILYAGGDMSLAGGVPVSNIAAWNGTKWSALSSKLIIREVFDNCSEAGTQVYTIKASGRYLVIGGHFRLVLVNPDAPCIKESYAPANNILLWDRYADEWYFLGQNAAYGVSGGALSPSVNAMAIVGGALENGGALYVGGEFSQAGSTPAQNFARFTIANDWQAVGGVSGGVGGALNYPSVETIKAAGADLYIGGNFTTAGTTAANYIARYTPGSNAWAALGSGMDKQVYAIDAASDGLYIGGAFGTAGSKPSAGFARWGVPISVGNITPNGGGTVTGDGVTITFPAGAVSSNTTVLYTPLSAAPHPAAPGMKAVRAFRFEAQGPGGQPVKTFSKPYTLRVSYTPQMLAAAGVKDAASLTLAYWNGTSWVRMLPCAGCGVDTTNKVITVVANHFTEFAVLGKSSGSTVFVPITRR